MISPAGDPVGKLPTIPAPSGSRPVPARAAALRPDWPKLGWAPGKVNAEAGPPRAGGRVLLYCPPMASPAPLRFRGNRSNPNHNAVLHLVRTYAAHLGLGLIEADGDEADIHWDRAPAPPAGPCLVFPGRATADPGVECDRTRAGFPVPRPSLASRSSASPSSATAEELLDACGEMRLRRRGPAVVSDWDLLSFCADILFRRAERLPAYAVPSREAVFRGLPDPAFGLDAEPWVDRWMFRLLGELPACRARVEALPAQARLWLTHDLDNLSKWRPRSVAGQIARTPIQALTGRWGILRRNWGEIAARAFAGRDPYDCMDRVHALEGKRRSASFFLANGRDHLFHRYELSRPRYLRVLRGCREAGKDIGLHGQVHVIADGAGIRAERDKISALAGAPVLLNRQHYLRWDVRTTFGHLEAAGLRVDSTLGYNDTPGFRCGTAWPFAWFDCGADRPTRLLEVPLILAEFHLYDPLDFDGAAVRAAIARYLDAACRQGGVFTVLFHNQYFHEAEFPGHAAVYADLIAMADRRGLPDLDPLGTHARYVGADGR